LTDARRPITAEDLYRFELISDPQISPDGAFAVYAQSRVDRETEKTFSDLWVVPAAGGPPRRFTHGDHVDSTPRVSPDGTSIAFLSNRDDEKQPQIYRIPVAGGEAERVTNLKGSIQEFSWSPDGTRLVVGFRAKDQEQIEREQDEKKKELGVVSRRVTRFFYKLDGLGFLPAERSHLWVVDVETGEASQLTRGEIHDEANPTWSPDGREILFCSNRAEDPDRDYVATDLFAVPATDGAERKIETPYGPKWLPRYSPDGRWAAYLGMEGNDPWGLARLWIVPADASAPARCLTSDHDVNVAGDTANDLGGVAQMPPTWSADGSRIYVQVSRHGRTTLQAVDLEGTMTTIVDEPGVVRAFSLDSDDNRLLYAFGTMTDPGQILVRDGVTGAPRPLTSVNRDLLDEIDLGAIGYRDVRQLDAGGILQAGDRGLIG